MKSADSTAVDKYWVSEVCSYSLAERLIAVSLRWHMTRVFTYAMKALKRGVEMSSPNNDIIGVPNCFPVYISISQSSA